MSAVKSAADVSVMVSEDLSTGGLSLALTQHPVPEGLRTLLAAQARSDLELSAEIWCSSSDKGSSNTVVRA